jgi:hypothetical protein
LSIKNRMYADLSLFCSPHFLLFFFNFRISDCCVDSVLAPRSSTRLVWRR